MAVIGSLSVKLGLVTVDWDRATAKAKQQAKDLQGAFNNLGVNLGTLKNTFNALGGAMGLSVAGMGVLAKATMDMAGQVDDLSKSYDLSIARILQFQKAIVMSGGKAEDANKILSTMFSKIASAQDGNESAIATFESLGLSFQELRNSSPDQMLRKVYEGLSNIGNTYERIKLTKELLGKGGLGKSVEEIAEALGQSTAEFKRQEQSMKKLAELGDALDATYLNLKLAIADFLSPFTGNTGGQAIVNINTFKAAMVAVTSVAVLNGMFKLVQVFKALNAALKTTASLGIAIQSAQGVKGIAMAGAALASYFAAKKIFDEQDIAVEDEESTTSETQTNTSPAKRGSDAKTAQILATQALLRLEEKRHYLQLEYINGNQYELALKENLIQAQEDEVKARAAYAAALSKENMSKQEIANATKEFNLAMDKALQDEMFRRDKIINQREKELALYKLESDFAQERINLQIRMEEFQRNSVNMTQTEAASMREELSLNQRLQDLYAEKRRLVETRTDKESPEYQAQMARVDAQIQAEQKISEIRQKAIEDERMRQEDFVTGWNYALQQYVNQANQYGRAAQEAFQSVIGNMNSAIDEFVRTGKFSFKDFAKSVIQDLIAIQMKMQAMQLLKMGISFMGGMPGAADGGFINQPTLVGENGAELFIPNRQGGTVIPNQQLSSVMGSQPQIVYNAPVVQNLSAIDTQSAVQFLTQNKSTIYAANQSASRSMPVSR